MTRRATLLGVASLVAAAITAGARLSAPPPVPAFAEVVARWTPSDAVLLDRHGVEIGRRRIDYHVRRAAWTPLEAMSPALRAAIVDGEDRPRRRRGPSLDELPEIAMIVHDRCRDRWPITRR